MTQDYPTVTQVGAYFLLSHKKRPRLMAKRKKLARLIMSKTRKLRIRGWREVERVELYRPANWDSEDPLMWTGTFGVRVTFNREPL